MKTVTHTSDGMVMVTHTSNGNLKLKLLSNRTLPVVIPSTKPRIDDRISPIGGTYQMISAPATKKVVMDAASRGPRVNRTPGQVIRTGVDGSTPGKTGLDIRHKLAFSLVLIVSPTI